MSNYPNGWLAALLTFIAPFLGFLYVGRWKWAFLFALAQIGFSGLIIFLIPFVSSVTLWAAVAAWVIFCGFLSRFVYFHAIHFESERVLQKYSRWYGLLSACILFMILNKWFIGLLLKI